MTNICPNNYQGEREHQWGWCSVTVFSGKGRSGTYAKCHYCQAEDWAVLDKLKAEVAPPIFHHGDTVIYTEEKWRYDITGSTKLDLVKSTDYPAIVDDDFISTFGSKFGDPLERWYSIVCLGKDGKLFERNNSGENLTPSDHGGTLAEWYASVPKPKPYKLEDDDPALVTPRLRCIGITFEPKRDSSTSRCSKCSRRYSEPTGFVRDEWGYAMRFGTRLTWRDMVEQYQRNPWNSHSTGWCPSCCHSLLPKTSKAYLKFKLTGEYPLVKYIQSTCDGCHKAVNGSFYYRSVGEDLWEVFCRECQYAKQSHDMMGGGFSHHLGSSSSYVGTIGAGESVTI